MSESSVNQDRYAQTVIILAHLVSYIATSIVAISFPRLVALHSLWPVVVIGLLMLYMVLSRTIAALAPQLASNPHPLSLSLSLTPLIFVFSLGIFCLQVGHLTTNGFELWLAMIAIGLCLWLSQGLHRWGQLDNT